MARLRGVVGARTVASAFSSEEEPSIQCRRCSRPTQVEPPAFWRRDVVGWRDGGHAATAQDSSPVLRRRCSRLTRGPQSKLLGAWTSPGPDPNVPAAGATGCCGGPRRMDVAGGLRSRFSAPTRELPSNLLAMGRRGGGQAEAQFPATRRERLRTSPPTQPANARGPAGRPGDGRSREGEAAPTPSTPKELACSVARYVPQPRRGSVECPGDGIFRGANQAQF